MDWVNYLADNLIAILAVLVGLAGSCLAVIGTLAGVCVGGIVGYETQKRLQIRNRKISLDNQKREMRRNILLDISSRVNALAVYSYNSDGLPREEYDEERKSYIEAIVEINAAIDDDNLRVMTAKFIKIEDKSELGKYHRQIQTIIRDEIDKTFDPNYD